MLLNSFLCHRKSSSKVVKAFFPLRFMQFLCHFSCDFSTRFLNFCRHWRWTIDFVYVSTYECDIKQCKNKSEKLLEASWSQKQFNQWLNFAGGGNFVFFFPISENTFEKLWFRYYVSHSQKLIEFSMCQCNENFMSFLSLVNPVNFTTLDD